MWMGPQLPRICSGRPIWLVRRSDSIELNPKTSGIYFSTNAIYWDHLGPLCFITGLPLEHLVLCLEYVLVHRYSVSSTASDFHFYISYVCRVNICSYWKVTSVLRLHFAIIIPCWMAQKRRIQILTTMNNRLTPVCSKNQHILFVKWMLFIET